MEDWQKALIGLVALVAGGAGLYYIYTVLTAPQQAPPAPSPSPTPSPTPSPAPAPSPSPAPSVGNFTIEKDMLLNFGYIAKVTSENFGTDYIFYYGGIGIGYFMCPGITADEAIEAAEKIEMAATEDEAHFQQLLNDLQNGECIANCKDRSMPDPVVASTCGMAQAICNEYQGGFVSFVTANDIKNYSYHLIYPQPPSSLAGLSAPWPYTNLCNKLDIQYKTYDGTWEDIDSRMIADAGAIKQFVSG